MAEAQKPSRARLFAAVMYTRTADYQHILSVLTATFGPVKARVEHIDFSAYTAYYDAEMGGAVRKSFLVFEKLIDRDMLADIKVQTNAQELATAREGKRCVNIDPGYLTAAKFVLASAKDFTHRIYLRRGIFAEVTLQFHKNGVRFFSWTYDDYRSSPVQDFLFRQRQELIREIS
ncbi:MAG: DUF4416 family protein [Fibrobacterota bacterium]